MKGSTYPEPDVDVEENVAATTPDALESNIRTAFEVPDGTSIVARDPTGFISSFSDIFNLPSVVVGEYSVVPFSISFKKNLAALIPAKDKVSREVKTSKVTVSGDGLDLTKMRRAAKASQYFLQFKGGGTSVWSLHGSHTGGKLSECRISVVHSNTEPGATSHLRDKN